MSTTKDLSTGGNTTTDCKTNANETPQPATENDTPEPGKDKEWTRGPAIRMIDSGDTWLQLSFEDHIVTPVLVSSQAMSCASPVWGKFMNPPFGKIIKDGEVSTANCTNSEENGIDFIEDDGEGLQLLLNIAHLRFKSVPKDLPHAALLQVATLFDKYDCADLVEPWLTLWLKEEDFVLGKAGQMDWLFIAWAFGREESFEKLAEALIVTSKIDDNGRLTNSVGIFVDSRIMLPGLMETVRDGRLNIITDMISRPYSIVESFEKGTRLCKDDMRRQFYDAITYGSLLKALRRHLLWPQLKPSQIKCSVETLSSTLKSVQQGILALPHGGLDTKVQSNGGFFSHHSECTLKWMGRLFPSAVWDAEKAKLPLSRFRDKEKSKTAL